MKLMKILRVRYEEYDQTKKPETINEYSKEILDDDKENLDRN